MSEPLKVYSDHKALEYFMTKKHLTARQARWAELLSQYHFKIQYHLVAKNQKADALTRREDDVRQQEALKKEHRDQVMLPAETLSPRVQEELAKAALAPVEPPQEAEPLLLIDRILQANRSSPSLQELRDQAMDDDQSTYTLKDGLLLAKGCVVVPDQDDQKTTAYPGRKKTINILRD